MRTLTHLASGYYVCLLLVYSGEARVLKETGSVTRAGTRLIGYYDAKSQKELPIESLRFQNLSHVVLTNAVKVDNQGNLILRTETGELPAKELIERLAALPPKLIISLRGHEDDVALDELSENDDVRQRFAKQMAVQLNDWDADGLEIEWHSDDPAGGKAATEPFDEMEQYHFALLCRDLSSTLRRQNKTLSVAVRPGRKELADGLYVRKLLDWLTLRAYSMRSLGDPHHSSLQDMKTALNEWEAKGVPRKQLVLGTPLFARAGTALHSTGDRNEVLRIAWKDLASADHYVPPKGDRRGDHFRDVSSGKAWTVSGINTTIAKVKHLLQNGYGGIAFRDLHHDAQGSLSIVQVAVRTMKDTIQAHRKAGFLSKPLSLFQQGLKHSRKKGGLQVEKYNEL
jgi:GH18 family chitinase